MAESACLTGPGHGPGGIPGPQPFVTLAVGAGRDFILRAEEPVDVVTKDDAVLSALYRRLSMAQRVLLWHIAAYMGTAATPDRWMRPLRAPTG